MTKDEWYRQLFERLDNSKFRSSFHLKQKDLLPSTQQQHAAGSASESGIKCSRARN